MYWSANNGLGYYDKRTYLIEVMTCVQEDNGDSGELDRRVIQVSIQDSTG
jgi:hypothetical protein